MDVTSYFLFKEEPIHNVLGLLESNDIKIVLVVDENDALVGTVTDGDIRRALLRGVDFKNPVHTIIAHKPRTMPSSASLADIKAQMHKELIEQMIIVDDQNKVVDIKTLDSVSEDAQKENWIVIMAGGLGKRLRPLTEEVPKPMLEVGGTPILEILINNFKKYGFHRFYISINYRGEMIRDYFGDGSKHGIEIRYIEEQEKLDTAGALSLIKERPKLPMFVINGDIVTSLNFVEMLKFHTEHKAAATMAIREYSIQVQYGVVDIDGYQIKSFQEKPTHKHYINAGVYLVEPDALNLLEPNKPCTMPDLFEKIKAQDQATFAFPIREYWLDVGRLEDYQKVNDEYSQVA